MSKYLVTGTACCLREAPCPGQPQICTYPEREENNSKQTDFTFYLCLDFVFTIMDQNVKLYQIGKTNKQITTKKKNPLDN